MDINNNYAGVNAAISAYQSVSKAASKGVRNVSKAVTRKAVKSVEKKNTDKIELSRRSDNADEIIKITAVKSLQASASDDRLNTLTSAVREGKYHVSAESIAAAPLRDNWEAENMDFQKLTLFMDEYLAHYRELLVFENGKLKMIFDDDVEGLNDSLSREQALIMKTNALETKRFKLQSGGYERKSFKEIIGEAPDNCRGKLNDQYRELSDLVFSIKKINDSAHEIVRRRLSVMEEAKKGFQDTYDRSGGKRRSFSDGEALDKGI